MSTVIAFMPMNLRLYDREEHELRTYVSPLFNCATDPDDTRGANTHIVADNGGGKSTLLLFFELLFCKPGRQSPKVGEKKVIDYLRRASEDLHDPTPTTMAALVRRDNTNLMRQARDTIFGYTVALRSDGTSLDLRRFVIPLASCPGFTLEQLARDYVYDSNGAPLPLREVRERLAGLAPCQIFDSSDWDGYVQRMAEAGISPILWRELAKMNAGEEAAESYFRTKDAFRNIVSLIQEAQQPVSGERAKDLSDAASDVARQVSTQERDRRTRAASEQAAERVAELAACVRDYAETRERMKVTENDATAASSVLRDVSLRLASELEAIDARSGTFQERRLRNEQLHLSARMHRLRRELHDRQEVLLDYEEDVARKRDLWRSAAKDVLLDEAARSWGRYRELDEQIKGVQAQINVLMGAFETDEALSRAIERAWRKLNQAERTSRTLLNQADETYRKADDDLACAKRAYELADSEAVQRASELGGAVARLNLVREGLDDIVQRAGVPDELQVTLEGFYVREALERVVRASWAAERKAGDERKAATQALDEAKRKADSAQAAFLVASDELAARIAEEKQWQGHLATTVEYDERMRKAAALWPQVTELAAVGDYDRAIELVNALRQEVSEDVRKQQEEERAAQARLDALASGRLDMSEHLRAWLDRCELDARTLASHPGIPPVERDRMFEAYPWLAHALVVDDAELVRLTRAASKDELGELGHAVFYVRQADVQRLLDATRTGGSLLVGQDGASLVGSLHTVERAFLEDPSGYEAALRRRLSEAHDGAERKRETIRKLDAVHDEVNRLSAHLATIGMEGKALADVSERAASVERGRQEAELARSMREDEWKNASATCENARLRLEAAARREREATSQREVIENLQRQNEKCLAAKRSHDEAEQASEEALRRKVSAYQKQEEARAYLDDASETRSVAQRERNAVDDLRKRLADVAAEPTPVVTTDVPCTSGEAVEAVRALEDIVRAKRQDIDKLQEEINALRGRRGQEHVWQDALRDGGEDGIVVLKDEIETWQPRDQVGSSRLRNNKRDRLKALEEARDRFQKADNEARLVQERIDDCQQELQRKGLSDTLEVPDDYDYQEISRQIERDEQDDRDESLRLKAEKGQVDEFANRLSLMSARLVREDAYRAAQQAKVPEYVGADDFGPYVTQVEETAVACAKAFNEADGALDKAARCAQDAVVETGEYAASRQMEESAATVKNACGSRQAMLAVADRLSDHSRQFETMAATLKNKLRATDEAIEDIVNRAVEEGYLLCSELHRLVIVSSAHIKSERKQPTIRFRSRGHVVFQHEFRRDEVATSRLAHYVRRLVTEVLPPLDEAKRVEVAHKDLAPHELVYLLLDDRAVDVQYPVIRGGRGLSYEGARDTSGSGSTGQKSAGYVLSFLALLRYLGNSGALSAEGSLFVALENQFGKISSSKIIRDIKAVSDQTRMQLITVAGRELASAYGMGDVVYALYRTKGVQADGKGSTSVMRVREDESGRRTPDAVIDSYRASRRFENLSFDF